jgi:hypothetical protein
MSAEHPDNARFMRDCERWIKAPIKVIKSTKYGSVDDVFLRTRYMSGIGGARCTTEMKKVPREAYQRESDTHIFGFTYDERRRADSFEDRNPAMVMEWILIDNRISKLDCLLMIEKAGIDIPAMYLLGFEHNNCIGCVKSKSSGYWNMVRTNFPETFEKRCQQSRALGVRLVVVGGERIFLDELPIKENDPQDDIECGPVCQQPQLPGTEWAPHRAEDGTIRGRGRMGK